MHIFLFALASGRQLLVGHGVAVDLLCGEFRGAYACGLDAANNTRSTPNADWNNLFSHHRIVSSPASWYQYKNVGASVMRGVNTGEYDRAFKELCVECARRSLRCPDANDSNGLDTESCAMVRAMQLLLPGGGLLQEKFARAAKLTANQSWIGLADDLDLVLKHSTSSGRAYDWDRRSFFNPPTTRLDASTRFAGAVHIRALPPSLEGVASQTERDSFQSFLTRINTTSPDGLWNCLARNVQRSENEHRRHERHWPTSLFVATDTEGLCKMARRQLLLLDPSLPPISCMDVAPAHIVKSVRFESSIDGGLDSHQLTVLDWHLLTRSRWLVSIGRVAGRCKHGAARDGSHGVHLPGQSFFGWALAASGLSHPPETLSTEPCPCQVNRKSVSVWFPPTHLR